MHDMDICRSISGVLHCWLWRRILLPLTDQNSRTAGVVGLSAAGMLSLFCYLPRATVCDYHLLAPWSSLFG